MIKYVHGTRFRLEFIQVEVHNNSIAKMNEKINDKRNITTN
jgi:hypothetical protein